ncbi:unnamed protein product [Paramecium pentaurelia]|uniref:Mitogen-activated protein kinase n=1 Tax=Paramecium pentaurelia TaxID=43138 RepID=A0A8S1XET1_9CILI|nr:unnamed protein product [Paramecium pentaurelia]
MDQKKDIILKKIVENEETTIQKLPPQIRSAIPLKHKVQCGGGTFEIYTHYELQRNIGNGAFGFVCSGKDKLNNIDVAIKKIAMVFRDLLDAKKVLREIKLLKFFDNPNIVKLLDIIVPDDQDTYKDLYLVFQLMHLDLEKVIQSPQPLTDKKINWCMYQIISGLYYMHSANIIHRDLKPNNIFINANCHIKIGDLNLARKQEVENASIQTDYVVQRWYRAPEVLLSSSEYTKAIDIWSLGCILGELLGRTILFKGMHHQEQIEKIVAVLGKPKQEDLPYEIDEQSTEFLQQLPEREPIKWADFFPFASPLALDLLENMLVYNPNKRYTIQQCIEHPYFKQQYIDHPPQVCKESFDWSFDDIELKEQALRKALYQEALEFLKPKK